jgi:hypothetical protein
LLFTLLATIKYLKNTIFINKLLLFIDNRNIIELDFKQIGLFMLKSFLFIVSFIFIQSIQAVAGIAFTAEDLGTLSFPSSVNMVLDFNDNGQALLAGGYYLDPEAGIIKLDSGVSYGLLSSSGTIYAGSRHITEQSKSYDQHHKLISWSLESGLEEHMIGKLGDHVSPIACNSHGVVVGTFSRYEFPGLSEGARRGEIFIWSNEGSRVLPLREKFKKLGYDAYGFSAKQINDRGQILGRCEYGQINPFKNTWISSGWLFFLIDGDDVYPICPPAGIKNFSFISLQPDGSVKIAPYEYRATEDLFLEDFSSEDSRYYVGYWHKDSGIVWVGHEDTRPTIQIDGLGEWVWDSSGIEILFKGSKTLVTVDDLSRLSKINQKYPGAKIYSIEGINKQGKILVTAHFYGDLELFLLTPFSTQ